MYTRVQTYTSCIHKHLQCMKYVLSSYFWHSHILLLVYFGHVVCSSCKCLVFHVLIKETIHISCLDVIIIIVIIVALLHNLISQRSGLNYQRHIPSLCPPNRINTWIERTLSPFHAKILIKKTQVPPFPRILPRFLLHDDANKK